MADISKIKLPDNTEYNIKDTTARAQSGVTGVKGNAESSYRTGNVNLTAANVGAIPSNTAGNTQMLRRPSYKDSPVSDVTFDSKVNTLRANRLAFLPADQIIIENTIDGGTTWTDAGVSDATKVGLFSETRAGITLPQIDGKKNPLCGVRITITAMKYNVPDGTSETQKYNYWNSTYIKSTERYNQLKEMYFWVSTSGGYLNVKVERATGANPNTWSVIFNNTDFRMTGYSGNDYISFSQGVFGGSTTQTGNYWNYRITFMTDANLPTGNYLNYTQGVYEIRGYGDTWWTAGNEYAANDKMYTHDYLKNVTFPAKVTATGGFSGALTGNVTGNVSGTASNVTGTVAVANGGTGQTTATNAANAFMNALATGSSTPVDADYYISQYVNGGSTTTTYHRRPMSALWEYIKGKFSGTSPISFSNGTISHANSGVTAASKGDTSAQTPAFGSTFKALSGTVNATGHLTAFAEHTVKIPDTKASTSVYGITKLSTSTSSTATDLAATPSAVKSAYDLANTANGTANTALSGVNGTLIYDHTYTITDGIATFVPHVYLKGSEVTSTYDATCFVWKYRLSDDVGSGTPTYFNLSTDETTKGCSIAITMLGYGGYVLGEFTPPAEE